MKPRELTTVQAAQEYGFNASYVARLAAQGKVKARKIGRDWLIDRADMERYYNSWQQRKPGPRHQPQQKGGQNSVEAENKP